MAQGSPQSLSVLTLLRFQTTHEVLMAPLRVARLVGLDLAHLMLFHLTERDASRSRATTEAKL